MRETIEGVSRRIRAGRQRVGVIGEWGGIQKYFAEELAEILDGDYAFVDVDVWSLGTSSDLVRLILGRIVETCRRVRARRIKKTSAALTYIAASVVAKASGIDFTQVVAALEFGDKRFGINPADQARADLKEILDGSPRRVVVVVRRMELLTRRDVAEVAAAARFVTALSDRVTFIVFLSQTHLEGEDLHLVPQLDSIVALVPRQAEAIARELIERGGESGNLTSMELAGLEAFVSKSLKVRRFRLLSAELAIHHYLLSLASCRVLGMPRTAPLLLGLKFQYPSFYFALVQGRREEALELMQRDLSLQEYLNLLAGELRATEEGPDFSATEIQHLEGLLMAVETRGI